MLIMPSLKKTLIVEQFQGNYPKQPKANGVLKYFSSLNGVINKEH